MRGRLVLGLLLIAFVAACSGSDGDEESGAARPPAPAPATPEAAPGRPAEPVPPAPTPERPAAKPDAAKLEEIVRAWSRALNAGDNEAAADLFAPRALVIQGELAAELVTHADAVAFNESLPCSGEVTEISTEGEIVTAVFVLGNRPTSDCDAPPGTRAAAQFLIRGGKILAWRQIPAPEDDPGSL
jgi:hypothetical protein